MLDWDVNHGNGTQDIFYERDDVLTISIHQEDFFPHGSGSESQRGKGRGVGLNLNVNLLPGAGHQTYVDAKELLAPACASGVQA